MVSAETHAKVEQMWRDEVAKNKIMKTALAELSYAKIAADALKKIKAIDMATGGRT